MDAFNYKNGQLFCEDIAVDELAARFGTPLYVYSKSTLCAHYQRLTQAFAAIKPTICFSIKTLGNLSILKELVALGSGMDVVSGGELFRARQAGTDMKKVVFAGIGKTDSEILDALDAGIGLFNIESEAEFENIAALAERRGVRARAALRVNPDVVDQKTHSKTQTGHKGSKFGVDIERARRFFATYGKNPHLKLCGIHMHIGSPIYSAEPYVRAITRGLELIQDLKAQKFDISVIDIGGGFAADYTSNMSPSWETYAQSIVPLLKPFVDGGGQIILEPGRTIAGNTAIILAQVQYLKEGGHRTFVVVDTGMHHLIRPALYGSFHFIWPTKVKPEFEPKTRAEVMDIPGLLPCDVVGPICESSDILAKERAIPPVQRGDLIAIFTAGAYGMVMASQYNAIPRPAEILVEGDQAKIIRKRETYQDLIELEGNLSPAANFGTHV